MSQQLDLLAGGAPRFPRARREDPSSSHEAAAQIERTGLADSQLRTVYQALQRWPGSTSAELAAVAKIERYTVARRLPELLRAGKVRRSEPHRFMKACNVSHKRVCRWWPEEWV